MNRVKILEKIEQLEFNANCLLETAATLKAELSGGSDSSNSQVLSLKHREQLIQNRRKYRTKK